ncbi:FGGY family carbohydrate kinase [Candidatus Bathyarchaeota archaeon]|nr:FGGY family carbohydrate kinase [Candidatus Bathyarchaeota archaeon]
MVGKYYLTCDIGTSVTKTVLYDQNFVAVASASEENLAKHEQPCWLEEDPKQFWRSISSEIRKVTQGIDTKDIIGVGATSQMHAPILVDKQGNPLFGCLSWPDGRTVQLVEEVSEKTGIPQPYFTSTAPKILWIKRHDPSILEKTYKILLPADFIRMKLTNTFCTDSTNASGTSMYDNEKKTWKWKIVDYIGLDHDKLPDVYPSDKIVGEVTPEAAKETGISPGIPAITGIGDFGIGRNVERAHVKPGNLVLYLGTGPGITWIPPEGIQLKPRTGGGVLGVAGTAPQWFKNTFCQEETAKAKQQGIGTFQLLENEATKIEPGVNGLIFLPHLMGERAYNGRIGPDEGRLNPFARGVFFGLCMGHTRMHMYRAILEGITYHLRLCWQHIQELNLGGSANLIIATGGGAQSHLWRQIIADTFNLPVCRLKELETSTLGLACLISVATGIHKNFQEAVAKVENPTIDEVKPITRNLNIYKEMFKKYSRLETDLEPIFKS